MLNIWKPLTTDFDRLFGEFAPATVRSRDEAYLPAADISETKDGVVVRMDIPGVRAEDIEVKFEDDVLAVKAERKVEKKTEGETFHRTEIGYGLYARSFRLPQSLDGGRIDARYEGGVLTLTLPKREEAKPRKIAVKG